MDLAIDRMRRRCARSRGTGTGRGALNYEAGYEVVSGRRVEANGDRLAETATSQVKVARGSGFRLVGFNSTELSLKSVQRAQSKRRAKD